MQFFISINDLCGKSNFEKITIYNSHKETFSLYQGDHFNIKSHNKMMSEVKTREKTNSELLAENPILAGVLGMAIIGKAVLSNDSSSSSRSSPNSSNYSSSSSSSSCKDFASLKIHVSNHLEFKPRFDVTPPENVNFEGGGGFIISNTKSDKGTVSSYSGCIAGSYKFVYSYKNSGKFYSYNGSFYLDGKNTGYDINISQAGLFSKPSVSVVGW